MIAEKELAPNTKGVRTNGETRTPADAWVMSMEEKGHFNNMPDCPRNPDGTPKVPPPPKPRRIPLVGGS